MKTILATVSAIGLLAAAPAYAATSAESTVNIGASVTAACGVGNHISGNGVAAGYTTGDIDLGELADTNGQFSTAISVPKRSFGNLWCNAPANVTLEVGSLILDGETRGSEPSDSGSFAQEFDLEVTTSAGVYVSAAYTGESGANRLVLDTSTAANGIATAGPGNVGHAFETGTGQYGGFDLKVLPNANKRPVAGDYSGYVKFTASVS